MLWREKIIDAKRAANGMVFGRGLKALDQTFIAKSSHISLMRDERHGRLAIRFMAVAPDLTTRSGFLGQARQAGTGAANVSLATWAVMKRACSRL